MDVCPDWSAMHYEPGRLGSQTAVFAQMKKAIALREQAALVKLQAFQSLIISINQLLPNRRIEMRTFFLIVLTVFFLGSFDQSFGQSTKKSGSAGTQQSGAAPAKTDMKSAFEKLLAKTAKDAEERRAGQAKAGSNTRTPGRPAGGGAGLFTKPTVESSKEKKATAKERYDEIFSSNKMYEVRLRNKSLAMRKGKFMGMAKQNKWVVFESRRQIAAVPADMLHKKIADKIEGQIEKAKAVFNETGVAFEEIHEFPDGGDMKDVGLAGRQKITMYLFNKPKEEKKSKKQKTAEDKGKSKSKG